MKLVIHVVIFRKGQVTANKGQVLIVHNRQLVWACFSTFFSRIWLKCRELMTCHKQFYGKKSCNFGSLYTVCNGRKRAFLLAKSPELKA